MLETFDLSTLHKTMRTHFPYCQKHCKINVSQCFTNCILQTYPQLSLTTVDKFFREHSLFPVHNNYSKFLRAFLVKCRAGYPQSNSRDLLPSLGCLIAVKSVFVLIARIGCRRRILVVRLKRQFDVCLFEFTFVVVLYFNSVTDLVTVKLRPQ